MIKTSEVKKMLSAVLASMTVLRAYQLGERILPAEGSDIKPLDQSLLSRADRESGEVAMKILSKLPLKYDIKPEDTKGRTTPGAQNVVMYDNADGTRPLVNGLKTSTVILAVYDLKKKKVVFVIIGEPISGDIWYGGDSTPPMRCNKYKRGDKPKPIQVNQHPLDGQATVFIDYVNKIGFARKTKDGSRQIFNGEESKEIWNTVYDLGVNILMPGSNGQHQAMVANGGEKTVAGLTLAMGGPWDAAGVFLVILAGGYARAFKRSENGFSEQDPLDPTSYDIAVYGNCKEAVDKFCSACRFA